MTEAQGEQEQPKLPPPTAPENISVSLRAFAEESEARRFGDVIAGAVRTISCVIDLERLDGITVAYDYDKALAELDRGYQATRTLTRTSDDLIVGVAMTPAVLRNGVVKAHLLFYAPAVRSLESEDSLPEFQQALYLVAHECAHVEALKHMDTAFPGLILQKQIVDAEYKVFGQVAEAIWDEYVACRISAPFGEHETAAYQEGLTRVLNVVRERANAAIRSYRLHADIERLLVETGGALCEPLRLIAYLVGHLDGRQQDLDAAPAARDAIAASPYATHLTKLTSVMRALWSELGRWTSLEQFAPLREIARDVLRDGGVIITKLPNGALNVKVPFTPETMPI